MRDARPSGASELAGPNRSVHLVCRTPDGTLVGDRNGSSRSWYVFGGDVVGSVTAAGAAVGGLIGGVLARSIAGSAIGGGIASCVNAILR